MVEDIGRGPERYAAGICENMRRNGERVWIAWNNKTIFNESGEVFEVLCIGNDITERKREQDELFSSRHMLQSVLDNIPQRVFWKDRDSVLLGCNKAFALDRGCEDASELVGRPDDEAPPEANAHEREVMETGRARLNCEEPRVKPDGSLTWLITSTVPMYDQSGQVTGVLGTVRGHHGAQTGRRRAHAPGGGYRTGCGSDSHNRQELYYRLRQSGPRTNERL